MMTQTRHNLEGVLRGDLGFHDESSSYASHTLHAFAAKFPPQLPRVFIERLTQPGDTVLDPMMGSGTALVEAALLGRRAIGADIDPLALRLGRVKTTPMQGVRLLEAAQLAIERASKLVANPAHMGRALERRFDDQTRAFLDYWFLPETRDALAALVMSIEQEGDPKVQDFLRVVFSSIIITKSGGVSRARDLAHSRPHRVESKQPRDPIAQFELRARKAAAAINDLPPDLPPVEIHHADARHLPLPGSSVDLVITSPPYANAIDYMRAHKFSLVWFGETVADLSRLRATYIGSEKCGALSDNHLPDAAANAIEALAALDSRKAKVLRKYFADMRAVLAEIRRVLRPRRAAVIVVGPSTMRGMTIATHEHLSAIAQQLGFDLVGISERKLDRDRRMMPARFGSASMNGIELRMHEEYVIGLASARLCDLRRSGGRIVGRGFLAPPHSARV